MLTHENAKSKVSQRLAVKPTFDRQAKNAAASADWLKTSPEYSHYFTSELCAVFLKNGIFSLHLHHPWGQQAQINSQPEGNTGWSV